MVAHMLGVPELFILLFLLFSRKSSKKILKGKIDGTFLVRPKSGVEEAVITTPTHLYTIDIV